MIRVPDSFPESERADSSPPQSRPLPTESCPCCGQRVLWHPPRITPSELRVVRAFRDHRAEHGLGATLQEVADAIGATQKSVWRHVTDLCDRGILQRTVGEYRSVVVLWDPDADQEEG